MKAVILAGGRGERLRPITDTRPKPLVPVLARPVMDYCLSLLAHHGVREAAVTTHYLADQIRHRYGAEAFGIKLCYSSEETPLGTAGGVKALEDFLRDEELFLVMSGDALCDFDLTRAVSFHKNKRADATIVLSSVKTPLEYGVVLSDTFERIFAFSEKPDWSETLSDLVNTGVYILSPEVLKKIPVGMAFDFSHDLFPLLLQEGYRLFGYKDEGYWCDIGKIPTLYRCNLDLIGGRARTYLPAEGKTVRGADGKGLSFIADGAEVESGAEIGSGSVLSPGVRVAQGARVSGSVVMEKCRIGKNATVQDAVLCENTSLQEGALALSGSVLGAGTVVKKGAFTQKGKKYPPHSAVTRSIPFGEESLVFTEKGAAFREQAGVDGNEAERIGFAFARVFRGEIAVLWNEKQKNSARFALAFAEGVVRGGFTARLLGEGSRDIASFAAGERCLPTVFADAKGDRGFLFAYERDALPLVRRDALRLARFAEEEESYPDGSVEFTEGMQERYLSRLADTVGQGREISVAIGGTEGKKLKNAAIKAGLRAYDRTRGEGIGLEIYPDSLKIFCDGKKIGDTEKARLFLIERLLQRGRRRFYLPDTAPRFFSEHIVSRGGSAEIFSVHQTSREDKRARFCGGGERWLFDLSFLGAAVLHALREDGKENFVRNLALSPDIYVTRLNFYPDEERKAGLLRVSAENGGPVGTRVETGFYGMKIISEALSFEAALDNAMKYRGKLYEIEEKLKGR